MSRTSLPIAGPCGTPTIEIDVDAEAIATAIAEALADLTVTIDTHIPDWADICINGCETGRVCMTVDENGTVTYGPWIMPDGTESATPPESWTFGGCQTHRMCVTMWKPNKDGTFFVCQAGNYDVLVGSDGTIKSWAIGVMPAADPTEGLEYGVDYVLMKCGEQMIGEIPTTQTVPVPYDVSAVDGIEGNTLPTGGTAELENVCGLTVKALVDPDCKINDQPVEVTYTDIAGNEITTFVPPGCTQEFPCLNGDVSLAGGKAYITATTTTEMPIETGEC